MQQALLTVVAAGSIAAATNIGAVIGSDYSRPWYLIFVLDVTTLTGTAPTLQLILEAYDPTSGKYIQWGTVFVAVSAAGTYTYMVSPGTGAAAGGVTAIVQYPPPVYWRARILGAGTAITNATYTLSVQAFYEGAG